jgi:predicted outer membrane protein
MKIRTALFLLAIGSSTVLAGPDTTAKLSDDDTKVVAHLHAVDQMEIDAGKLAQTNGAAPGKAYGKKLVTDHTSFDTKLVAFAKKHGVTTIPDDTMQTEAEKKDMMDEMMKLKGLKGAAFDSELGTRMAADHDKEIGRADAAMGTVGDKELAAMLKTLKPTLQAHADAARKLTATK